MHNSYSWLDEGAGGGGGEGHTLEFVINTKTHEVKKNWFNCV